MTDGIPGPARPQADLAEIVRQEIQMEVYIKITRSDEWVKAQRLTTGQNIPKEITVKVEPSALSLASRELLLVAGGGEYPQNFSGGFKRNWQWDYGYGFGGNIPIVVDCDAPSPGQIDLALSVATAELAKRKEEAEADAIAREAAAIAKANEWAALPLSTRASEHGPCYCMHDGRLQTSGTVAYDRDDLRRLVPSAWAEAEAESERLKEIASGRKAIADRETLSEFLAWIPNDALRGALKSMAQGEVDVDAIQSKIDAAATYNIFEESDED